MRTFALVLPWKEQLTKRARRLKNIHPIYICTLTTNWPFRNLGRKKIPKISLYRLWKKGLVKQGVRIPLISDFISSSAKQSITQTIQGWCVFRLLSKMVREDLRISLNFHIQAVNLRVLFRTGGVGQPSCRLQMLPMLKSPPGLLNHVLEGNLEKHERRLFWDLFMILECKHQEQLCSMIYSSRPAQITKKWLLSTAGGHGCCWLCPGLAKAAVVACTGCKTCLEHYSRYSHRRPA